MKRNRRKKIPNCRARLGVNLVLIQRFLFVIIRCHTRIVGLPFFPSSSSSDSSCCCWAQKFNLREKYDKQKSSEKWESLDWWYGCQLWIYLYIFCLWLPTTLFNKSGVNWEDEVQIPAREHRKAYCARGQLEEEKRGTRWTKRSKIHCIFEH